MKLYQREAVALIMASGTRLAVLHEHRLIDLWSEYSHRQYDCCWVEANREEVYRFVTWTNSQKRLGLEILQRTRARSMERLRRMGHSSLLEPESLPAARRYG